MTDNTIPILANFDDVKKEIWESDLILIRNRNGKYIQAAKAAWWGEELFCLDVQKYRGLTAVPIEQLLSRHSGLIDVYEVNPQSQWENFDRPGVTDHLKKLVFSRKDCRSAFLSMVLKWFGKAEMTSQKPYGVEAIRLADRLGGGVEPVPDRLHERITIVELGTSPIYRYRFTLK